MGLQSATPTLTSSTLGAGYQDLSFHVKQELKNYSNRSNRVKMISPTITASESGKMCFSFWFAAFGAGDTTSLKIYK